MPLHIHQFPCLDDNYGYLVRDAATGKVGCIDTPDADTIAAELDKLGWGLDLILNTHWHPDHAGGNEALQARYGAVIYGPQEVSTRSAEMVKRTFPLDHVVTAGDEVRLGETVFTVVDVGGHTREHIAYYDAADHVAFVGDSVFPLGCGRMFEGTKEQMWAGLMRIADLPEETRLYSAHEYTAANARFALTVDHSQALKDRADQVFAARDRGEWTVPTTVGVEKATNPFLRAPLLARPGQSDPDAFWELREAKDHFKG